MLTGPVTEQACSGLDFSQQSDRLEYANDLFGEKPPIKKSISFVVSFYDVNNQKVDLIKKNQTLF